MTEFRDDWETNAAISPGEILDAELRARDISQKALAGMIGRPPQVISEIVRAKKQKTAQPALELEKALGIKASHWMRLEAKYRLDLVRRARRATA
ncbi:MAG: helix-turn-helix domain-containing protein [Dehalococcoidia bacterium]|nr:helix-turn-helix domain-containing protein [Dehalococcoidia bacterium]